MTCAIRFQCSEALKELFADMLEEPVSRIRQIYDVIEKTAPDYDAETIYKQFCEKEK
ncbi:MAG: hypothetical protein ACOCN3_14345 [Roseburia inulinivorans]